MRIQFDVPEPMLGDLKMLMKTIGVETYKDLINNALTLLDWAVSEAQAGREIAAVDEQAQKYRELAMPILDHARRVAQRQRAAEVEEKPQPVLTGTT